MHVLLFNGSNYQGFDSNDYLEIDITKEISLDWLKEEGNQCEPLKYKYVGFELKPIQVNCNDLNWIVVLLVTFELKSIGMRWWEYNYIVGMELGSGS